MNLQVIEHNGVRVLTTQQLAEAYETSGDLITRNFNRNKDRYIPGKHYMALSGDEKNDFIDRGQFDRGLKNAQTIYLWTEKGCFLAAKSLNTDRAWEAYDKLIDGYFTIKQNIIDRSQLSPQMQMLYGLIEEQAKQEIEQKRQAAQLRAVETKINNIQEIFIEPISDWKNEINKRVREISINSGIRFEKVYNEMYGELESTAHCCLNRLQENKKNRMEKAGNTRTAIKEETTKIAIVHENPRLKAIFEGIVKKWAMRYCA